MEATLFSKEEVEELSNFSNEVISILRRNEEQFTENKNGYIFDVSRLKDKTIVELKRITTKPVPNFGEKEEVVGIEKSQPHEIQSNHVNKYSDEIANKVVTVSPKFLSEYNSDFQKLTAKPASMMKFLNAKKKYLKNSDQSFTKIDLKKETYV